VQPLAKVHAYIYARTVPCPDTGASTPLVPDWHLSKPKSGTAIVAEPVVDHENKTWTVRIKEIGRGAGQTAVAPRPTYVRGTATSIFTGAVIDGDYIKAMAKQGKLGSQLYAVVLKAPRGLDFRPAEQADRDAISAAATELARLRPGWERDNIIPTELVLPGEKTPEAMRKGIRTWADMFAPRQLLAMGVLVEELRKLRPEVLTAEGDDRGEVIEQVLALAIDKMANYNAILSFWHPIRGTMANVFDRHDFAFKPTFAEMALTGGGAGLDWALENTAKSWRELSQLPVANLGAAKVRISLGSATNLASISSGAMTAVVVDPPYADNVQYSELADFFYVWLKRTQGQHRPEWYSGYLCDHSEEAVVNTNRQVEGFDPEQSYPTGTKKAAKLRAQAFYADTMSRTFGEAARVLRDDGVLTVMFTHKAQSAWVSLFEGLINAGFVITATWPIKTEARTLNNADKNSAESTVILVARQRPEGAGVGYFTQEMRDRIRAVARSSAERLRGDGLNAVDQLVGSFGPAMEVFSRYKQVKRDTGEDVGVAEALDEASDAVAGWRIDQLMARGLGAGLAGVEAMGRYAVLCWDVLAAAEFRFNEAKLLGNVVGLSPEDLVKTGLAEKKSQNIKLHSAVDRRRDRPVLQSDTPSQADLKKLHPNDAEFRSAIDGAQALVLAYVEAGSGAAGIGAARALSNRHAWQAGSAVARLAHALVLAAPKGVQVGGKGIANKYPDFLAWHALLQPLWGIEPPDWREQPELQAQLTGFGTLATEPLEADEDEIEDEDSDDDE
jgi:adenine-specific DNA methylase